MQDPLTMLSIATNHKGRSSEYLGQKEREKQGAHSYKTLTLIPFLRNDGQQQISHPDTEA